MSNFKPLILVVDDEPMQREMLREHLSKMSGYEILDFGTGEECMAVVKARKPVIVFLDYFLNNEVKDAMDGLEVLKEIKEVNPDTDVVMISGQDKIEVAVNTMKYGAFDYIVKGEGAFHRAEKTVFNIYRFHKLQDSAARYRKLMYIFAAGMILMIVLVIVLQQMGYIKDNPGWI